MTNPVTRLGRCQRFRSLSRVHLRPGSVTSLAHRNTGLILQGTHLMFHEISFDKSHHMSPDTPSLTSWPWVWALHRRRTRRQWRGCPGCTGHMTRPPGGAHQPRDHCYCDDPDDDEDRNWDLTICCSPGEVGTWCGGTWPCFTLRSPPASDVRHS